MANMYDIVIVGGGPGGYSAALYAARAGLHAVVLEKQFIGGQAVHSENIENYPGFDAGIDGLSLSEKMQRGAERFGAEMVTDEVRRVHLLQPVRGRGQPFPRDALKPQSHFGRADVEVSHHGLPALGL